MVLYLLAASLWHAWVFILLFAGSLLACASGGGYDAVETECEDGLSRVYVRK